MPPLFPLAHEVLISLRSNDYFVGTPIDDEAKGERQRYSKGIARVYNLEAVS
jgi:hypothetical protein